MNNNGPSDLRRQWRGKSRGLQHTNYYFPVIITSMVVDDEWPLDECVFLKGISWRLLQPFILLLINKSLQLGLNILSAGKMSDSTFCWAKAHMRFTFHIAASNPGSLLTSGLCLTHDWMYEWKGGSIPNGLIMGNQQSEGDARFMMEYLRFCIIIRYFDKGNDYFDKRNHSTVYILSKMKLMNCSGYGPVQPNPTSL